MKFLRRNISLHLRIGKRRKGKQVWRKPKGRDNKMRESRKGRPPLVSIGYKRKKEKKNVIMVYNLQDLENAKKYDVVILGKVGRKKKTDILKRASEMKLDFQNVNIRKFLKKNTKGTNQNEPK
ncbi:MAG: eL32 family ribosomal protein [Candidatus Pacearchaeota archaeon]|nr:eL32 family ribosomal protein [Nanoarchaeota archaeon]MDZ4226526.1 eL32 family ribosomal protein [Candidatus Pacearchaeota archaeon]